MQDGSTPCRTHAYSEWTWLECPPQNLRRLEAQVGPCMPCKIPANPKALNMDGGNSVSMSIRTATPNLRTNCYHPYHCHHLCPAAYIRRANDVADSQMGTAVSPAEDGGYDELAALMVKDKGLSTFRSYMKLNTQNLLILQAEITLTEKELRKIIQEDQSSGEFHREKYRACVSYMKEGFESSAQWEKWMALRELLEKYSKW